MRTVLTGGILLVSLAACASTNLSVSGYATRVEGLVADMHSDFASLDTEWESQTPTVRGALSYWDQRLTIRVEFLDDIRALDPPPVLADQHTTALDLFARITAADEALAARAATFETLTEHRPWLNTPEGQAAQAVLEEVYEFCRDSQERFDSTADRGAWRDTAWIPPEMKEVVKVAFGCPP